jgi:hypothetical protein
MSTNQATIKPSQSRLERIHKVSKGIRFAIQCTLPVVVLIPLVVVVLLPIYGITSPREHLTKYFHSLAMMSPAGKDQMHYSPTEYLPLARLVIFFYAFRAFIKMLRFFEKGIIFAAETVRCVKILGGLAIVSWLVELIFQLTSQNEDARHFTAGLGNLFQGCVIFFVAWIMDEGRKIREEQELTV